MAAAAFTGAIAKGDRVVLAVSYDGSAYSGWQSQRKHAVATVQDELEKTLGLIANQPIRVQCAGRTDAGVHASEQIVHFDSPVDRPERAYVMGANTNLPSDIAVHWARVVDPTFNARFSATARRYRYIILNTPARPAILGSGLTRINKPLDQTTMHSAAQALLGEQDFTSYRASSCQSRTPMRNVHRVDVSRRGALIIIDIEANAFLHHMVRNIAGVLIEIGAGLKPAQWAAEVLAARDRCQGAATAAPHGLYLVNVSYPDNFLLPRGRPGPHFLGE